MIGHYQGAATDPLWQRIAAQIKCTATLVSGVYFALLEHSHAHGPDITAWSVGEYAQWASAEPSVIDRIIVAMRAAGVVVDNQLAVLHGRAGHDRTQAARARRYRQRKAAARATSRETVTRASDTVTENRDASARASRETVTVRRQSVTESRDACGVPSRETVTRGDSSVTASRGVTENRDANAQTSRKTVTNVTVSRSGKGGGLGGGMGFSSSSLLHALSHTESTSDAPAPALAEQMLEKLKSAGAIQSHRQLATAQAQVLGWVGQGVTLAVLTTAIELARAARIAAGSDQPINVAYVGAKLDSAMRAAPISVPHLADAPQGRGQTSRTDAERASILGHYARLVDFGQLTRAAADAAAAAELAALDARLGEVA